MIFVLDKPHDRLITERVQVMSGWIDAAGEPIALTARCGDQDIPLREFSYPTPPTPNVQGFWGYLVLQELLCCVEREFLAIDLFANRRFLRRIHLRVSPVARELASNYPLNLKTYQVRNSRAVFSERQKPHTLVFPGLGGVGGSSLNQLLRAKMFQQNWPFPIYGEANDRALWSKICATGKPAVRWIDGHECYSAADDLGRSFARITLLREPVRRLVSIFNYISIVHPDNFPYATFEEFISAPEARRYCQAFELLRCAGITVAPAVRDDELYALAKMQLQRNYSLVGITEMFEETIFLMCDLAGYADIGMWWRSLSAPQSIHLEGLSNPTKDKVRNLLAVDAALYEESTRDFLQLCQRADFGETLGIYKKHASEQAQLPETYKMVECLRWRQILVEEQLAILKQRLALQDDAVTMKVVRRFKKRFLESARLGV